MGAAPSRPADRRPTYRTVSPGIVSEKSTDELVDQLSKYLHVKDNVHVSGEANPISGASLEEWRGKLFAEPKNRSVFCLKLDAF